MQQEYLNYLIKIVENQRTMQKTRKSILYALLNHWFIDKNGLTAADLQDCLDKGSTIYRHLEELKASELVNVNASKPPHKIMINIEKIEELGRQQREKELLKNKIVK